MIVRVVISTKALVTTKPLLLSFPYICTTLIHNYFPPLKGHFLSCFDSICLLILTLYELHISVLAGSGIMMSSEFGLNSQILFNLLSIHQLTAKFLLWDFYHIDMITFDSIWEFIREHFHYILIVHPVLV